ncbi:MAG: ABC transporter ATP-binding protein [Endozoicomonas sp.]
MTALRITGLACDYGKPRPNSGDAQSAHTSKTASEGQVLSNINLSIEEGEIVCLLGRSGCGKSTLLKTIAGLIQPVAGTIDLHGKVVSTTNSVTPPELRGIGMIFQDYALFPHLNVFDNVAFGLKKRSGSVAGERVKEMLTLVNLHGLEKRYPHELSGGQQQRVAIARALANKPSLLLLDEPFSNIDSQVRQHLVREIRDILKQQNVAGLFVTHSRDEGFAFADIIAVMEQGSILQQGSAFEVYHQPGSRFIADFMGAGNYLPARIDDLQQLTTPLGKILSTTPLPIRKQNKNHSFQESAVELFVRPAVIELHEARQEYSGYPQATIVKQQFMGDKIRSEVEVTGPLQPFRLVAEHTNPVREGSRVIINVKPHSLILFDADGN